MPSAALVGARTAAPPVWCQPPHTLQPRAPAPSQDRAPAPVLPPCPGRGPNQAHPTSPQGLPALLELSSEGLGSEEPMLGPAAPDAAASPPSWHNSKGTSRHAYPGQEVGKPHGSPVSKHPRVRGSGLSTPRQRARAAAGGQWVGAGRQPHTKPSLPGKGKGARGKGGPWEVLGAAERHQCPPRRHMLLQGPLCVLPGWVEAVVNSTATGLQMGPGHCQQLSPPLECPRWQGRSTPGYMSSLGLQKSGPVLLPGVMGLWDVVTNVESPRFGWCTGDAAALFQGQASPDPSSSHAPQQGKSWGSPGEQPPFYSTTSQC